LRAAQTDKFAVTLTVAIKSQNIFCVIITYHTFGSNKIFNPNKNLLENWKTQLTVTLTFTSIKSNY